MAYERWPGARIETTGLCLASSPAGEHIASNPGPRAISRRYEEAGQPSEQGLGLPRFVEKECQRYLKCGVLAHGFATFATAIGGHDLVVAFCCKRRGVWPLVQHPPDIAAHLVDAVIPRVPVQCAIRCRDGGAGSWILARDAQLASRALAVALRVIFADYRRRAQAMGEEAGAAEQ